MSGVMTIALALQLLDVQFTPDIRDDFPMPRHSLRKAFFCVFVFNSDKSFQSCHFALIEATMLYFGFFDEAGVR